MANTNSLLLNGTTQYAYAADSTTLSSADISLEAWIKVDSMSVKMALINKSNDDTTLLSYRWQLESTGKMNIVFWSSNPTAAEFTSTAAVITGGDVGNWVHVALTLDASEAAGCKMYKNGVSVAVDAKSGTAVAIQDTAASVYIGGHFDGGLTYIFDGAIDEARIWNDVRTAQEIFANYRKELVGNEAGLSGYWKFNSSTRDSAGFGNNLTLVGSPSYSTPAFTSETAVFYVGAGDGQLDNYTSSNWATTRDSASAEYIDVTSVLERIQGTLNESLYQVYRNFYSIDTSAIRNDSVITAANFHFNTSGSATGTPIAIIVGSSQVSPTTLALSDFSKIGTTKLSDTEQNIGTVQAYSMALNSAGKAWINKSGWTCFAIREKHDFDNSAPTDINGANINSSRWATASERPYLEVTYTTSSITDTFRIGTADGSVQNVAYLSWADAHALAAGDTVRYVDYYACTVYHSTYKNVIYRGFLPVDTSGLPDGAVITAATINVYPTSVYDEDNVSCAYLTIIQAKQASTSELVFNDFSRCSNVTTPIEGIDPANRKDLTSVSTNQFLAFNLNPTGINWINKTGYSMFGIREGHDTTNTSPSQSSTNYTGIIMNGSGQTTPDKDPYMTITYTTFDLQRQNIINGLVSAQSEANGWNAEVKAKIPVTDVVRTSDTIATITLSPEAAYNITATETVTSTVPPTALLQTMNTNSLNLVTASSQYAMREGQSCTKLSGLTSMTWEFWVKFDIIGIDYNIIGKNYRPSHGNSRSWMWGFDSTNKLSGTCTDDGTAVTTHYRQYYADIATTVVGVWQHYAISYNGTAQTLVVIKDGSTIVPMTNIDGTGCTGLFDNPTADFYIGGYNDCYWIDGQINEVRVWSDVRTPAEILANYNKQLVGTEANLEGYWRFNSNGLDLTVNGNDLTLVNAPTYTTDVPFYCGTDVISAPTFDITGGSAGPANVKTFLGLASASTKTLNGIAIASVKTWNGIA